MQNLIIVYSTPQDFDREQTFEYFSIVDPKQRTIHFGQHDHVRY